LKDFGELMKQTGAMQKKLQSAQSRLAETIVEAEAGSGLVTLSMSGNGDLLSLNLQPALFEDADPEMVADLVMKAHREARAKLDAASAALMRDALGPLAGLTAGMPGLRP
jgi:nucleoid-associated protein EbfC